MDDLVERLIDEADGYGDGPVVMHDIEGLRALLRERQAERTRHECESAMLSLDDALRDHEQEVGDGRARCALTPELSRAARIRCT